MHLRPARFAPFRTFFSSSHHWQDVASVSRCVITVLLVQTVSSFAFFCFKRRTPFPPKKWGASTNQLCTWVACPTVGGFWGWGWLPQQHSQKRRPNMIKPNKQSQPPRIMYTTIHISWGKSRKADSVKSVRSFLGNCVTKTLHSWRISGPGKKCPCELHRTQRSNE